MGVRISSSFVGRFGDLLQRIRGAGVGPTLRKAFHDHVYQRGIAIQLTAPMPLDLPPPMQVSVEGYTYRVFRFPDDLERIERYFSKGRKRLLEVHEQGATVVAAFFEGDVVGLFATTNRDFYEAFAKRVLRVPADYAYYDELHVAAPHRGRGLHIEMMRLAGEEARERGCTSGGGHILESNQLSLKLHLRMGYREVGSMIVRRKLLGWVWSHEQTYQGQRQAELLETVLRGRGRARQDA